MGVGVANGKVKLAINVASKAKKAYLNMARKIYNTNGDLAMYKHEEAKVLGLTAAEQKVAKDAAKSKTVVKLAAAKSVVLSMRAKKARKTAHEAKVAARELTKAAS